MRNRHIYDNITVRGYSHILSGKECQDSSVSWKGNGYSAIIVCDGHGGDRYFRSATGSMKACEIGKAMISGYMERIIPGGHCLDSVRLNKHNYDAILTHLESSIISEWVSCMESDIQQHPFADDERYRVLDEADKLALNASPVKAYGSTFIAAILTDDYGFIMKLGDGNALVFSSDDTAEMPPELDDTELQFNSTTSLCNSDALQCFRHVFIENRIGHAVIGVTLTSDGVINCYRSMDGYLSLMKNIYRAYDEDKYNPNSATIELSGSLETFSKKGSGDDLSVAIVRRVRND